MPKYFILFVSLTCVAAFFSCKKKDETVTISVLTYNVAGLPEGISQSHPTLYQPIIGQLINNVDVVHAQEDFYYHDSLIKFNTHPYVTLHAGVADQGGDGLTSFSHFPIHNLDRVRWTDCAGFDCIAHKGFSYSQIEISPGVYIDFYNAHTNASVDAASMAARQKNTRQLCEYIKNRSSGKPVIIMGDMNSRYTRSGDSIRNVLELGFVDVWITKIRNNDIPPPNDISLTDCGNDGDSRTSANCEKVDKIFYRSSDKVKIIPKTYQLDARAYYYNNNDTVPLSDHWPVFSTFEIIIEK